ncbi:unnamed protein product [Parajaminaea phylloscopi]
MATGPPSPHADAVASATEASREPTNGIDIQHQIIAAASSQSQASPRASPDTLNRHSDGLSTSQALREQGEARRRSHDASSAPSSAHRSSHLKLKGAAASPSKGSNTSDEEGMIREDDPHDDGRSGRNTEEDLDRTDDEEGAVDPADFSSRSSDHAQGSSLSRSSPRGTPMQEPLPHSHHSRRRGGFPSDGPTRPLHPSTSWAADSYVPLASQQRYRGSPERERERERTAPLASRFQVSRSVDERVAPIRPPPRGGDSYRPNAAANRPSVGPFRGPANGGFHDDRAPRARDWDREAGPSSRDRDYSSGNSRRSLSPSTARGEWDRWQPTRTGDADAASAVMPPGHGPRPGMFVSGQNYHDAGERGGARSWSAASSNGTQRRGRWSGAANREREVSVGTPDIWRPPPKEEEDRGYGRSAGRPDFFPPVADQNMDDANLRGRQSSQHPSRYQHPDLFPSSFDAGRSAGLPHSERRTSVVDRTLGSEPSSPTAAYGEASGNYASKTTRPARVGAFDPPPRDSGWGAKARRTDEKEPSNRVETALSSPPLAPPSHRQGSPTRGGDDATRKSAAESQKGPEDRMASPIPPALPVQVTPEPVVKLEADNETDADEKSKLPSTRQASPTPEIAPPIAQPAQQQADAATEPHGPSTIAEPAEPATNAESTTNAEPTAKADPTTKAESTTDAESTTKANSIEAEAPEKSIQDRSGQVLASGGTTAEQASKAAGPEAEVGYKASPDGIPVRFSPIPPSDVVAGAHAEDVSMDATSEDADPQPAEPQVDIPDVHPTHMDAVAASSPTQVSTQEGLAADTDVSPKIASAAPPSLSEQRMQEPISMDVDAILPDPGTAVDVSTKDEALEHVDSKEPVFEVKVESAILATPEDTRDVPQPHTGSVTGKILVEEVAEELVGPSLPPQKTQEEMDCARRATMRRKLMLGRQVDGDASLDMMIWSNRKMADETTWGIMESVVHGPPQPMPKDVFSDGDPAKTDRVQAHLMERIKRSNLRLHEKVQRLRKQYSTLNVDWKAHCAKLDRAAETREKARLAAAGSSTPNNGQEDATPAQSQPLLTPSAMGGRSSTRRGQPGGALGLGDAVRSEAEFLEILASLESADMQDPEARAARTATTVPDQEINPDGDVMLKYEVDERNGYVADPVAYYLDGFDPDFWSQEEKAIFARKYALWPKQFGRIATALPNKTANQCVHYYYITKHQPGHDYKAITAARNRNQKRKARTIKPKKGRGSALMADLKSARGDDTAALDEDESSPASPMEARSRLASASVDAGLPAVLEDASVDVTPFAPDDPSAAAASASMAPLAAKKRRHPTVSHDEVASDGSTSAPAPARAKGGPGRGGKRVKGQGKVKAAAAAAAAAMAAQLTSPAVVADKFVPAVDTVDPSPSPSVESSAAAIGTPIADASADSDLAAAEALGALSGGFMTAAEVPAVGAAVGAAVGKVAKKRVASNPVDAGTTSSEDSSLATAGANPQRKPRQTTSSYWSIQERADFLRGVAANGKDWTAVATSLSAKSAAQARNYFARNAEVAEFVEAAALGEKNAELPADAREQAASEWIKERLGPSATLGGALGGAVGGAVGGTGEPVPRPGVPGPVGLEKEEASPEAPVPPPRRPGGMGIMSLLNNDNDFPSEPPSRQGWPGDEGARMPPVARRQHPLAERLSSSSEGETTDSENLAFEQYHRVVPPQAAFGHGAQQHRLHEAKPRPYLPEARGLSGPHSPGSHVEDPTPTPTPSLPRLPTRASEHTMHYPRSPVFAGDGGVRRSPLLPPVRGGAERRPVLSVYDRSGASMPPPPPQAASAYSSSASPASSAPLLTPPPGHHFSAGAAAAPAPPPPPSLPTPRRDPGSQMGHRILGDFDRRPPPLTAHDYEYSHEYEYSSRVSKYPSAAAASGPPARTPEHHGHRRDPSPAGGGNYHSVDYSARDSLLARPSTSYGSSAGVRRSDDSARTSTSPFLPRPLSAGGISAAASAAPPPPLPSSHGSHGSSGKTQMQMSHLQPPRSQHEQPPPFARSPQPQPGSMRSGPYDPEDRHRR